MKRFVQSAGYLLHNAMVYTAALIVPLSERTEWRREWQGELWHVRQACAPSGGSFWQDQGAILAFCLGAFNDAACVRRATDPSADSLPLTEGTPRHCLLTLVAILVASYTIALLLPGVRAERSLWPRKVSPNLVLIRQAAADDGSQPTISPHLFRSWRGQRQKFFDGFAFYRIASETMQLDPALRGLVDKSALATKANRPWHVAEAGPNLFTLLGVPVEFADSASQASPLPAVLLSERTWKRYFGADPHVSGMILRLGERHMRIAGVAADGSLGLPGNIDVWELAGDVDGRSFAPGFVVGRLTQAGRSLMWSQCVRIGSNELDYNDEDFIGVALGVGQPAARTVYLFALLLALLALPAITSVSLGENSSSPQQTSWTRRLFRWSFFVAKTLLLLPIVYFASMNLAYGFTSLTPEQAIYVQLSSAFGMCLFSLRWALKDQRQRCPVCMHLVMHPAQVGQASRTFLDWNGTEMMCLGGHTLLHVPSLPTSWFGAQRWLYLDTSWNFLFAGSTRPAP